MGQEAATESKTVDYVRAQIDRSQARSMVISSRGIVAADSVGAGVGENVFFVRGKEASFPFYPTDVPADAGIVGIVDSWHVG